MSLPILPRKQQIGLCIFSLLIVAFGQPVMSGWLGLIAAACGYALFWRVLLCYPNRKQRFFLAVGWFTIVQLVQLSWFISHPYLYIYSVYFFISLLLGVQFGLLSLFIDPAHLGKLRALTAIACLWTILEWSRIFLLSGLSWNPVGIELSGNIYSMQMASLWGVFGLSFWVMFVNLLALRAWWLRGSVFPTLLWIAAAVLPYVYGYIHLAVHDNTIAAQETPSLKTVLVQTAFPVEEEMGINDQRSMVAFVIKEWRQILKITKKQKGKPIDLMVLPEFVVPYGTYSWVYPYEAVQSAFKEILGDESLKALPRLESPWATTFKTSTGQTLHLVNNAFWAQAISNYYQTGVLIGFEDAEEVNGKIELYSAAVYFKPQSNPSEALFSPLGRYEKRVLVPMGEYIPFAFCRTLAAAYGVYGSFTPGKEAKVFSAGGVPFGVSICYEETFGNIVRENKQKGAAVLANLTNDAWYPNSTLTQQHFDHARLRTVECGIPLIRACNTGITGAVDSLGRIVGLLGEDVRQSEWTSDSIHLDLPVYTYGTLYTHVGDALIIGFSFLMVLLFLRFK